jgi:transposase InsO family protein
MSLSNNDDKGVGASVGSLANGHLQAPRLQTGGVGYATWKPSMDVHLQRMGADGIHRKPLTEAVWKGMVVKDEAWKQEAFLAAMQLALTVDDGSASSSSASAPNSTVTASSKSEPLSSEVKEARKLISTMVERSQRVFGVLYSALPDELRLQVAHLPQGWAYGLWIWLESKFQSTEEDSVGDLLAQWTTLQQEVDETFDAYRARVNKVNVLLEQAKEKPSARMYAFMLLDRLQPRYKAAVLALKAGGQLKDAEKIQWDTITSLINAHERTEARLDGEGNARAMAVARVGPTYKDKVESSPHGREQGSMSSSSKLSNLKGGRDRSPSPAARRSSNGNGNGNRTIRRHPASLAEVRCFNCNELGHLHRDCTASSKPSKKSAGDEESQKAVKFRDQTPTDGSKSSGNKKAVSSVLSNNRFEAISDSEVESESESGPECDLNTPAAKSSDKADGVNAVTEDSPSKKKVMKVDSLGETSWGIDTMASMHVSSNKKLFSSLRRVTPVSVTVADRGIVTADQCGTIKLRLPVPGTKDQHVLLLVKNVYYHPSFALNLLSWGILKEKGWKLSSDKEGTVVVTPGGNRVLCNTAGRISAIDGCGVIEDNTEAVDTSVSESNRAYSALGLAQTSVKDLVRLHEVTGHSSFSRMIRMIRCGRTLDLGCLNVTKEVLEEARKRISHCVPCSHGKGARPNFGHRGLDRGQARGEVLHMDTFQVRYTKEGKHQVEHGLTVTDPFTKWRWFNRLTTKDQVAPAVKAIVRQAQTQLGCKVKRLYADGGTEFVNQPLKSFCEAEGIELRWSPPRTQQLNGIAESAVRWTKDNLRTLMAHSRLPPSLWWRAAHHAVFMWNRTELSSLTNSTPFEAMYGKKPSIERWGVFGCDVMVNVPKEQRGASLAPKTEAGIYLGHDATQNCPVVLLMSTRKSIETRDVTYQLDAFTHATALSLGDDSITRMVDATDSDAVIFETDSVPGDEASLQGGEFGT